MVVRVADALVRYQGDRYGYRYREVLQLAKRLRLHPAGGRRPRRVRSCLGRGARWTARSRRGTEGHLRHRSRPQERQVSGHESTDRLNSGGSQSPAFGAGLPFQLTCRRTRLRSVLESTPTWDGIVKWLASLERVWNSCCSMSSMRTALSVQTARFQVRSWAVWRATLLRARSSTSRTARSPRSRASPCRRSRPSAAPAWGTSAPNPKFARECAASACELRNRATRPFSGRVAWRDGGSGNSQSDTQFARFLLHVFFCSEQIARDVGYGHVVLEARPEAADIELRPADSRVIDHGLPSRDWMRACVRSPI